MAEMAEVELIASTGSTRMDGVVRRLIAEIHTVLPGRLRAVYVLGSYADASAVSTSDLDLELIIAGRLRKDERVRIQAILADYASSTEGELDIGCADEDTLQAGVSPTLKLGGRLLWGINVCQTLDLMPLAAWTRDRMHTSYWRLFGLFSRPLPLSAPLDYPDPADEFYGYARRLTRLPDGHTVAGTRDLMRAVGWMATALVAYQAGQYIATKRACASMYREYIGDQWSDLLDELAVWVRGDWQYRIPADPEERSRLRAICARTLGFENHFLRVYRDYALAELRSADPTGRQMTIEILRRVPLADAMLMEVVAAAEQA
ncbi:MAG TPA: hypothetical protein VJR48_16545 [Ktedonobacterales bacterium]|nr:hypothetical protein [Ktedonobacterales bacterium]